MSSFFHASAELVTLLKNTIIQEINKNKTNLALNISFSLVRFFGLNSVDQSFLSYLCFRLRRYDSKTTIFTLIIHYNNNLALCQVKNALKKYSFK